MEHGLQFSHYDAMASRPFRGALRDFSYTRCPGLARRVVQMKEYTLCDRAALK